MPRRITWPPRPLAHERVIPQAHLEYYLPSPSRPPVCVKASASRCRDQSLSCVERATSSCLAWFPARHHRPRREHGSRDRRNAPVPQQLELGGSGSRLRPARRRGHAARRRARRTARRRARFRRARRRVHPPLRDFDGGQRAELAGAHRLRGGRPSGRGRRVAPAATPRSDSARRAADSRRLLELSELLVADKPLRRAARRRRFERPERLQPRDRRPPPALGRDRLPRDRRLRRHRARGRVAGPPPACPGHASVTHGQHRRRRSCCDRSR